MLTHSYGLAFLGLWSLLSAGSMFGRAVDFTGGTGLARFLVPIPGEGSEGNNAVIQTATISTTLFMSAIGVAVFFIGVPVIDHGFTGSVRETAFKLWPMAVLSGLILAPAVAALSSALDGLQHTASRSVIMTACAVTGPILTWVMISALGAPGFAAALILQQLVTIGALWIALSRLSPGLPFFPHEWHWPTFRKITGFGLRLQLNSLAALLTEPIAKILIGQSSGLVFVGLYELALRYQSQLRGLLASAAQPLIAFSAITHEDGAIRDLLAAQSHRYLWLGVLVCVVAGSVLIPAYSFLSTGKFELDLAIVSALLGVAFVANSAAIPTFFISMGKGVLRWNILSQAVASAVLIAVGYPLGRAFGGYGVVSGLALGITAGSAISVIGNSVQLAKGEGLSIGVRLVVRSLMIQIGCILVIVLAVFGIQFYYGL